MNQNEAEERKQEAELRHVTNLLVRVLELDDRPLNPFEPEDGHLFTPMEEPDDV